MSENKMIAIQCAVKKYHWGKKGSQSIIAQYIKNQNADFDVDENAAYAELWMGTHPSGPALVAGPDPALVNHPLSSILHKSPEFVGNSELIAKYGANMPFLFKVLSVEQPLSIQTHPDKELAKLLHEKDPLNYPDNNHKPEMAIALSAFDALLSFRPIDEIRNNLQNIPELRALIGENNISVLIDAKSETIKDALQSCFSSLMNAPKELVEANLKVLSERIDTAENISDPNLKSVFNKVYSYYPKDIGCFSIFFLNAIQLQPYEAIFLPPNEPHAYLFGDCIECMACSDNVIRAGLTPKYKDVQTLCNSLTYDCKCADDLILKPKQIDKFVSIYKPDVDEFAVEVIRVYIEDKQYELKTKESGSFLIVLEGNGSMDNDLKLFPGFTCFIPALTKAEIISVKENLILCRSYCP
ncbi:Phosphomannose isomerase and protein kinase domain containing protein-like protein [Dinothrombium tinctorium]|uniref:mannose-6-phosphate isomerase n=1 Tax=Dinothrombium tinctorium TaxID=1965070 RepID=A0A3S3PAE5_9ACAR|nr:Phosphomannose isomerase and protein kinase domain containing protein-like protein [Dinothrombium tinctorium]RWS11329.1 Phosphomannose isomerase and protein kinase domain containing protein-like protein [Dinothrombium tinctorium]RWS17133.1 Phosphomannose isomerase and protein kinase domain containing protein-like protein [Dinothrombium tinctorium]